MNSASTPDHRWNRDAEQSASTARKIIARCSATPLIATLSDVRDTEAAAHLATGRTILFSTGLNADTDKLIRRIAGKHGILIAEVVLAAAKKRV